jgi:cytochrome c oxidase subunit I
LFTRKLTAPVPIPFAQAFGGRPSYAISPDGTEAAVQRHELSPLASVLEHLGALTALTTLVTLAAYIPIFWPFVTHVTAAHGWKVW